MKKYFKKSFFRIIDAFLLIIIASSVLFGCFLSADYVSDLEFTVGKINMNLGDEIDLYDYLIIKPEKQFWEIKILSANKNIASANSALRLSALSVGRTTIRADIGKKSATCSIEVSYRDPQELSIYSYGDIFQSADNLSVVDFVAVADDYINPKNEINWYINDVKQSDKGEFFSFLPKNATESYVISAKINGTLISDAIAVTVYDPIETIDPISVSQNLNGTSFLSDTEGIWEWFVSGESVYFNNGKGEFDFIPTHAGIYDITATLYGKPVMFDNDDYRFTVSKSGTIVPSNITFEFDNAYPDSFISWNIENVSDLSRFDYFVKITDLNGIKKEYSSIDNRNLFDGCTFNSSGIINITNKYVVEVSCMSGGMFAMGQAASLTTESVSTAALPFLNKKCLDSNYYVTSNEEFFDVYENILWLDSNGSGDANMTVYFGYTSEFSRNKLYRYAWSKAAQAGLYYLKETKGDVSKGSIFSADISFASDNSPTKTTDNIDSDYGSVLLQPHINYGASLGRRLSVEDKPLALDIVETSNELYFIVEKGFRPNIKSGSKAEELYNYAMNTLRSIVTDEMDEIEKIHAIYDWVMWRTRYDKKAEKISDVVDAVQYTSYYLESVLTDSYPYTVCDGISKTVSLLCNMEGIACIRVVGRADGGSNKWGEHAWNKVLYEDAWYLLDCTWGDYEAVLDGKTFESASHQFLMLSSGELSATHRENGLGGYPESSQKPFLFVGRTFTYDKNSVKLSFFNDSSDVLIAQVKAVVDYLLVTKPVSNTYTIGSGYYCESTITYFGIDILVSEYLRKNVESAFKNIFQDKNIYNYIITGVSGRYMYILIKY